MTFCPNNQLDDLPTRGVTIIGTLNTVLGDLSVRCNPPRFRVQNAEISPMRTMEINAEIIHSDELAASIHLRQYDLTRLDDDAARILATSAHAHGQAGRKALGDANAAAPASAVR